MRPVALLLFSRESEAQLQRAVASAREHFSTIVVGDASLGRLADAIAATPEVSVIPLPNLSISDNRRRMVEAVGPGEWCMFLDGDDAFHPEVGRFLDVASTHDAEAFIGDTLPVGDTVGWSKPGFRRPGWPAWYAQGQPVDFREVLSNCVCGAGSLLFRSDTFLDLQFYGHRNVGEDYVSQAGVVALARRTLAIPLPTVLYTVPVAGGGHATLDMPEEEGDPLLEAILHLSELGFDTDYLYDWKWNRVPVDEGRKLQQAAAGFRARARATLPTPTATP